MKKYQDKVRFWSMVWILGIAGQLCWNIENQWYNTFIYAKIAKDPTIIAWMVGVSALATTISTFLFGTISDRTGQRRKFIAWGYIFWGLLSIAFGFTQYITNGIVASGTKLFFVAGFAVILSDAIMSFFGSMGNDIGLQAFINDHMNDNNRGQLGAVLATQPIIGTIAGTIFGGMLIGSNDNYMRLFLVMGCAVIVAGILALFLLKDAPNLKPSRKGSFRQQFFSIFRLKQYLKLRELAWTNLTLMAYFIAFNMYFPHLGNYMIYYLCFTPEMMGYIEGSALILAMLATIPATRLINRGQTPFLCTLAIGLTIMGLFILGCFVRPDTVSVAELFNPILLIGVFLIGLGYVLFLQAITVWSKQLYPADARGQFEGIRILFAVLLPMVFGPMLANPIIKKSGKFTDANGFVSYLPTYRLFLVAIIIVLLTLIPLFFATKCHKKRGSHRA